MGSSASHCEPSQRAMRLAGTPPADEKSPTAMSSPLYTMTLFTAPFMPAGLPSGSHEVPFHRAMRLTVVPLPFAVKLPAAISSPLYTVIELTKPLSPEPSADHEVP